MCENKDSTKGTQHTGDTHNAAPTLPSGEHKCGCAVAPTSKTVAHQEAHTRGPRTGAPAKRRIRPARLPAAAGSAAAVARAAPAAARPPRARAHNDPALATAVMIAGVAACDAILLAARGSLSEPHDEPAATALTDWAACERFLLSAAGNVRSVPKEWAAAAGRWPADLTEHIAP